MKKPTILALALLLILTVAAGDSPSPQIGRYTIIPVRLEIIGPDLNHPQILETAVKLDTATGRAWFLRYVTKNGVADWAPISNFIPASSIETNAPL